MKLILHHFLKDIRAQRWLLLLWAALLLVSMVGTLLVTQPDYYLAQTADRISSSPLLGLIRWLTWMFLLVQVIQSEPVRGSASFWLTRPVPTHVYIFSKLIFIVGLLMLPSLLITPLSMIWLHTDPVLVWYIFTSALVFQALLVLVLLWLATFTRSLIQFCGVTLVLLPGVVLILTLRAWISLSSSSASGVELNFNRAALGLWVFLLGLLVSLLVQHFFRGNRHALSLGVTTTVLALVLALWWPFKLPMALANLSFKLIPGVSTVSRSLVPIEYSPEWQNTLNWQHSTTSSDLIASASFTPVESKGAPSKGAAANTEKTGITVIESIRAKYQPTGGQAVSLPPNYLSNQESQINIPAAIHDSLPALTVVSPDNTPWQPRVDLFSLTPSQAGQFRNTTGILRLDVSGSKKILLLKAAIPLASPAFARISGQVIHVRKAEKVTHLIMGMEMSVPGDGPVLCVWTTGYQKPETFPHPIDIYLLVDPQNNTGVLLQNAEKYPGSYNPVLTSRASTRDFLKLNGTEPLNRMVLYIYELESGEFTSSELTAPNFKMSPP